MRSETWFGRAPRILIAALPLQLVLLRFGEPNGRLDQVGVLLTIAQWMLVGFALKPRAGATVAVELRPSAP